MQFWNLPLSRPEIAWKELAMLQVTRNTRELWVIVDRLGSPLVRNLGFSTITHSPSCSFYYLYMTCPLQQITGLEKCSFFLKNMVSCLCLTHTDMFTEHTFRGLWLAEGSRPCYKWQRTTRDLWVPPGFPTCTAHSCGIMGFPLYPTVPRVLSITNRSTDQSLNGQLQLHCANWCIWKDLFDTSLHVKEWGLKIIVLYVHGCVSGNWTVLSWRNVLKNN